MKVAIAGGGRVATSLALALAGRRGGVSLAAVWSRRASAARSIARRCGLGREAETLASAVAAADVLLICVADDAVATVAKRVAMEADVRTKVVLHTSGALGLAPLRRLAQRGAAVGSMHPLAVFPPANSPAASSLFARPIGFTLAGAPRAIRCGRRLVGRLGGIALQAPRSRAAYHAAAVLLANHVTVLAAIGLDLLDRRAALAGRGPRRAFIALLRTAADRIEREGAQRALTGPATRGDIATIRGHLSVLARERPEILEIYRRLSLEAAQIASRRGDLSRASHAATRRALKA